MSGQVTAQERLYEALDDGRETVSSSQPFQVVDQGGAIWALRKLAKLAREKAEIDRAAAEEIARIGAWQAEETNRLTADMGYFEALLTDYHRRLLEADPRAKTVKLPGGQLRARAQQPEYARDDERLLAWLEGNELSEYVKVKKSPDWSGLKAAIVIQGEAVIYRETGERIDGVTVAERPVKFSVEVE